MKQFDWIKKCLAASMTISFLVILLYLSAIIAPSVVLAENHFENNSNQSSGSSSGGDTLTFLSNNNLPFGGLKDGKPIGFAVEIVHEIMLRLDRADTIEFGRWATVYERTLTEPDTVLWPPSRTPEREKLFKWVGPLIPEKLVLFARKDSALVINSLEDAKKVSGIATVTGYASERLLRQQGFSNLVSQRSQLQGPDALKFGRVDLWISSNISMRQSALEANVNSTRRLPDSIVRTIPVVKIPNTLVAKINTPEITRTADLFGSKVAVVKGFSQAQYLDKFPRIEKVYVDNIEEGFDAVRMGRVEYFLNNLANAGYVLKKTFATDLRLAGILSYADFPPLNLSFGIHAKDSELPGIINKALAAVPIQTLSRLRDKWLDDDSALVRINRVKLTQDEQAFIDAHPVLQVAYDIDWPPVAFVDKDPGMKGMAVDYLNKISELLGVEFKPGPPQSWKNMLHAVESGELDFFSAISSSSRIRKNLDFTESYLSFPIVILTGKEVPYIGSLSDLKNKPVAVVDGYASHDQLIENHSDLTLLPVQNVKQGLMNVSTGKAFAFVGSLAAINHVMSRERITNLKISGETDYSFDISMGFIKIIHSY